MAACLLVWVVGGASTLASDQVPSQTETRLRAIYEQGDFRAGRYRVAWLADSTGYVVEERPVGTEQPRRVMYRVDSAEPRAPDPTMRVVEDRDPRRSPDGTRVLETHEGRLVVRELTSGQRTPLAQPGGHTVFYQDPAWSPDGRRVVFIERDESAVRTRASLDDGDPSYPGVRHQHFARVGETIARLRVGIVGADGQHLQWLAVPSADEGFYLGQVEWAASSDEVVIERFSRFRDQREVFLASAADGALRRVFHERSDAWVEGSQGRNSGVAWLSGGRGFVVVSEQDGWRHAYRVTRDGAEVVRLTPGDYDLIDRAVIDEPGGWYYFYASPDDATRKHLFRVPLDGSGKRERITPADQAGTHHYDVSPDARWAIHTWSSINTPPISELVELPSHRRVRTHSDHPDLRERLAATGSAAVTFERLDIGNGITLDAWLLRPRGFDPARKYPVLIYVYGEPHAQTVVDEWGAAQIDFHRVVADLGYVVASIDNRGTPAPKGAAWRRADFGNLGPLSTEEQEAGLKALARLHPFIDRSRVAIWGWSGGGSNTLNALFRKPESYHVGIAVVPKPQPHLYNAWFQEIFMRTPAVNAAGYERSAPITFANGLAGRLLIISGSGETNTHLQSIEGLVDRLIELGKPFDYMVYPNRDHGLREGAGTLVHVRLLIIRYLLANLPAGAR